MQNNVIICQPKILPTIYINSNNQSNYNYSSHQYSTTTNQIKTISNTPYQTYTTPVYYNYNQNSNTYTSNYSGDLERQTYKNTPNIKIAENYGIIDQNNLQKLQVQKRPSAGMTQNYNLKSIPNTNNINNIANINNVHYNVNYNQYTQPKQNSNTSNINNYYYLNNNSSSNTNNINNYNYLYNEKRNRKYNYEHNLSDNYYHFNNDKNHEINSDKTNYKNSYIDDITCIVVFLDVENKK